jgi:acyl carrier protein
MNRQEIENKVINIISYHLLIDIKEEDLNSNFIADLGADSLDLIGVIMLIEEEFDLPAIPDKEAENILTTKLLIDYIENKIKE